jgi:hypothetical protein
MKLEGPMLREIYRSPSDTHCVIPLVQGIQSSQIFGDRKIVIDRMMGWRVERRKVE